MNDTSDPDLARFAEYEDFHAAAAARLDPSAYDYYASGGLAGTTLRANEAAWAHWLFRKRVFVDVSTVDTATSVLGTDLEFPVMVAPTAFHGLAHHDGEVATAGAVRDAGTAMIVSTLGNRTLEDVASTGVPRWFQLYIHRSRDLTEWLAQRAVDAGYRAIVLTADTPQFGIRYADHRNTFRLPPGLELANLAGRTFPIEPGMSGLEAYARAEMDASLTWDDVGWLAALTPLPLVIKGVTTADDARRCIDAGVAAIVVSNHGGRQLDGDAATADALPEVVEAVGDAMPVLVDGGIRHGSDVLRALALGASAVLVGRPVLWALAAAGPAGVERILGILRAGLVNSMQLAGVASLDAIDPALVERR